MDAGLRVLGFGYGAQNSNPDGPGTIIVGLALLALGLGIVVMNDGWRSKIGGVLLMLWGVTLFFPGVNGM